MGPQLPTLDCKLAEDRDCGLAWCLAGGNHAPLLHTVDSVSEVLLHFCFGSFSPPNSLP